MRRGSDLALTALAPMIWGTTYVVTTQALPAGYPLTAAMLRAFPAGLLILALNRRWPPLTLIPRLLVLGALNFTLFWAALFVAAYRLPGGLAATLGAVQPLIVLALTRLILGHPLQPRRMGLALVGLVGVALLVLAPGARPDALGLAAALGGAVSMALGVVLTRLWRPPVPALTLTGWQLTAGGLLLVPLARIYEPTLPPMTSTHLAGFVWLGLAGGALSYLLWFCGLDRLGPETLTTLGFLSPLTAVALGWLLLGQGLGVTQIAGSVLVLASVWWSTRPDPRG